MHRRISLLLALVVGCASSVKQPTATITVVGGSATVPAGTLVQVDGSTSSDPQGLTLQFTWSLRDVPAGSKATLNSTSIVSPSFVADVSGSYVVALLVSDGVLSSSLQSVTIIAAACGGNEPNVTGITFTQGATTETTAIALPVTDAGTDAGADGGPAGTDAGPADAGPVAVDGGITDGGPADGGSPVDGGSNDAGAIDAGVADAGPGDAGSIADAGHADAGAAATVLVFEQLSPIQLSSAVVDDDTNSGFCVPALAAVYQYAWSLQGPAGSAATLSNAHAENPTFTPDLAGLYTVALQVTDLNGHTGPVVSAIVIVSACGDQAPVVTLAHASTEVTDGANVIEGPAAVVNVPVTLTAMARDPDNAATCDPSATNVQAVTVNWTLVSLPFGSQAILSVSAPLGGTTSAPVASTASLVPDVPGNYVVSLGATDSTGLTATSHLITFTVAGCTGDHPPAITAVQADDSAGTALPVAAGNAQGNVGQAVEFTSTVTDADNTATCAPAQTFTYEWTLINQPAASQAKLNDRNSSAPGLTLDTAGTYTVQLVVTDSTGLASLPLTSSVIATTPATGPCGNRPPTITAQTSTPVNAPWNQTTQLFATNQLLTNGQNPVCGASCTEVFTVDELDKACVQNLSLRYAWSFDGLPPGSHAAFLDSTIQNPSFVPDVAGGNYLVRLTVTDSRGLSSVADVSLHTPQQGANPPVVQFNAGVNSSLGFSGSTPPQLTGGVVGQGIGLNLGGCNNNQQQITDADDTGSICNGTYGPQTFTYAWNMASAPAGSQSVLLNPASVSPSFVPDVQGTYRVQVVVTDSTGLSSATATLAVVVSCGGAAPQVATVSGTGELFSFGGAITATPPAAAWNSTGVVLTGSAIFESGAPISFEATAFDPNNVSCHVPSESLMYTWSLTNVPAGSAAVITGSGSNAVLTPDIPATYTVSLTVSDASGTSAVTPLTFSVSNCNLSAPVLAANAISVSGGADVGQAATFSVNQSDITDSNVTSCTPAQWRLPATYQLAWSLLRAPGGSAAQLLGTTSASPTLLPDVAGSYEVGLVVTDASGAKNTLTPGAGAPGTFTLTVGACGSLPPSAGAGAVDCSLPANAGICQATQNAPSSGNAPYNVCGGAGTNCLTIGSVAVTLAVGHSFLVGSLTPPANFNCLTTDTWSSMTYQWEILSAPAASSGVLLQRAQSVGAVFRPDVAGTFIVGLTVTNELGKSSTTTMNFVVQ